MSQENPPSIDPRARRLLSNPDFKLFLKGMAAYRVDLFEQGESDREIELVCERRGKRKMLAILIKEEGIDLMFKASERKP